MTHHKKFENESQDARRRDKHNEVHPDDKMGKKDHKQQDHKKSSDFINPLKK
jgi:hypothetical protein